MTSKPLNDELDIERRVWELLTRDYYSRLPPDYAVKVLGEVPDGKTVKLQIFEVVVAVMFAQMQPGFEWFVTPNRPDGGLDFVGRQDFLEYGALNIHAAVTVGGQCKKRSRVDDIVGEVAGSLARMATTVNPTFFVVALSARLNPERVQEGRRILEDNYKRHCHILDRRQIEGLIGRYLPVVREILHEGLEEDEVDVVLEYLAAQQDAQTSIDFSVSTKRRVLAGVPFTVGLDISGLLAADPGARLWWEHSGENPSLDVVSLITPVAAEGAEGMPLRAEISSDDPIHAHHTLELVTHSVGTVDLGWVGVGVESRSDAVEQIELGEVQVIENVRPRFFEPPFRAGLERLAREYDRALASGVESVGVVGMGGSGKSRLGEEFALERKRQGCAVVTAKHAKTHEEPQRILGELMIALAGVGGPGENPAEEVIQTLERYDPTLAERAGPAIRSTFGGTDQAAAEVSEQSILSALVLLVIARCRNAPLIVHLQDLHWCSAGVLSLLESFLQQLTELHESDAEGLEGRGVLFIFEGRVKESGESGHEDWSSVPFEGFLARTESEAIRCAAFSPDDGLAFARRLFEDRHNAHRILSDDLLQLQDDLVMRVWRSAGGNPFHTLEQIRLLKEQGVVGQNPRTGLMYMIRPAPTGPVLPDSVFAAIRLRWQYMRERSPDLALLVWGSALLDDQLATPLFGRLWRELAPEVSARDIDSTDMLWTGDGAASEVGFRHENYFESIRRFTVSEADRQRVVEAYLGWYADQVDPSPAERFAWARALLEMPSPDQVEAKALLASALESARQSGDARLTQRISAFYLDLVWTMDKQGMLDLTEFMRHCDEEADLCRDCLGFDRDQAGRRMVRLGERVTSRLKAVEKTAPADVRDDLLRRLLTAEALEAQMLFNDRRPAESADLVGKVIAGVQALKDQAPKPDDWRWLEMEALYTQSCARAICGEFDGAVKSSAGAAAIAEGSRSLLARKVISTYGSMLLKEHPRKGETVLRDCLAMWGDDGTSDAALVHVHLCMALVLQAHRSPDSPGREALLAEARDRMARVHDYCRRLGLHPDAGAAALVRGVASGIAGDGDEATWFAQGVAAAAKGKQMETLWRSHINLAMSLCRGREDVPPTARDHAVAAYDIMVETLAPFSEPERTPRFELLRIGMAAVAWMLLASGEDRGRAVLERYPSLRSHFSDPEAGVLAPFEDGPRHFQWLRVDEVNYVLY